MSASQHRYTCAELGMCQARTACMECERPTVPVVRMINSRRVHTVNEPTPFQPVSTTDTNPIPDDAPITRRSRPEPPRPSEPMERCTPEHRLTGWFWFLFGAGMSVLLSGLVLYAK